MIQKLLFAKNNNFFKFSKILYLAAGAAVVVVVVVGAGAGA